MTTPETRAELPVPAGTVSTVLDRAQGRRGDARGGPRGRRRHRSPVPRRLLSRDGRGAGRDAPVQLPVPRTRPSFPRPRGRPARDAGSPRSERRRTGRRDGPWSPAGSRSAGGSPRCAWPTGCRRPGSCSSGTRCIRPASRSACGRSTWSGSRCRWCSCRGRGTRSRAPSCSPVCSTRLGDRATLVPVEGGDHSFRVRGRKADDGEIGAALAGTAAPFVRGLAERR